MFFSKQMRGFKSHIEQGYFCKLFNTWFYKSGGSPKNKEMVHTPMDGSPNINCMVNKHLGSSPKLKVYIFTLVLC